MLPADSMIAIICKITATSPGMMKFAVRPSGLNKMIGCAASDIPLPAFCVSTCKF